MARQESVKSLRDKIRLLEQKAQALERAAKPGMAQLQAVIRRYNLTIDDVQAAFAVMERPRQRGVPKGTRLKPKYRNPANPRQTWAGRGLKPRWIVALLKQGKKLEDIAI
jgi:DNA-binding protein H-NS